MAGIFAMVITGDQGGGKKLPLVYRLMLGFTALTIVTAFVYDLLAR